MTITNKFFNRAALAALLFCSTAGTPELSAQVQYSSHTGNKYDAYKIEEGYRYPSEEKVNRTVDSVFRKLSTREKIAQIMVIEFSSKDSKKQMAMQNKLVKKEKIGGLIPMNDVLVPAMKRMNALNKQARIPLLITLDGEWGANMRWKEIPPFPRQMQLGALSSDSLVYQMGYLLGKEHRALKIQVNFAPDIDINNNPSNPAINTRSFGEDKEKVSKYGAALMQGMKDAGVAGSAKHFPGHGDTDVDSHLALPVLPFSYERLDTLEMYPFKHLIAAGVDMVMVGHLNVPALDPSGTPSSISKKIVTELLREKLGFKGIICTDALNMHGVATESGLDKKEIPLAAYKAGADILLMPEDVENSITVIENAIKRGEITMASLNERVKKMLALKARLGLFDKGYSPYVEINGIEKRMITDENLQLMQKLSKNSMTIMFNDNSEGYGIPVQFEGKKVAYVGYKNPTLGREFAAVANKYGQVDTVILESDAGLAALRDARNKLRDHDLIIFGFNDTDQRPHKGYGINPENISFITQWAKEQPMIAVYQGSPYAFTKMPGYKNFTALVMAYSPNQANNFAAAQVVFGGIPAIGVLPVTAADYTVGHSIVLPDKFREEYFNFIGSPEEAMENEPMKLDAKASAYYTVLPQACELIACGRANAAEFAGHLKANPSAEDIAVMEEIIGKYSTRTTIEDKANRMFANMEMRKTSLSAIDGKLATTKGDLMKFTFMVNNNGKYAGKQILSPAAAEMLKKLF